MEENNTAEIQLVFRFVELPGNQITMAQLRKWCKLPSVYVGFRWGHVEGKLKCETNYGLYGIYLQGAEGHAQITFSRDSITKVVYIDQAATVPYCICLGD